MIIQLIRFSAVVLAGALLTACQTGGLKPGSVKSNYSPAGWVEISRGGNTLHACPIEKCKTPQAVLVGPIDIGGDVETAIRKDILSAGLLKEVDRSISRATDGQLVVTSRRKVVTKTYSGFEATIKITADNGKAVYVATRSIVQNDRGMQISSISTSEATARANLNSYLARTTIKRVQ